MTFPTSRIIERLETVMSITIMSCIFLMAFVHGPNDRARSRDRDPFLSVISMILHVVSLLGSPIQDTS